MQKGHTNNPNGRPKGSKNSHKLADLRPLSQFYEELVGVIKHDSFYVYKHETNSGECFYIGKGSGSRAWQKSHARNQIWMDHIKKNPDYKVRIVAMGLTENEALIIERELIMHNRPLCNVTYNDGQLTISTL